LVDSNALDDYVWKNDGHCSYSQVRDWTYKSEGRTSYLLNMTSQKWPTGKECQIGKTIRFNLCTFTRLNFHTVKIYLLWWVDR